MIHNNLLKYFLDITIPTISTFALYHQPHINYILTTPLCAPLTSLCLTWWNIPICTALPSTSLLLPGSTIPSHTILAPAQAALPAPNSNILSFFLGFLLSSALGWASIVL